MSFNKLFTPVLSLALLVCCSKSDSVAPAAIPVLSIQDVTQTRTKTDGSMRFYFNLGKKNSTDVSVDYTTANGSAISPDVFTSAFGTLTIPANTTSAYVDIAIKGDPTDLRQPNLVFSIQLSNPVGCTLGVTSALGTIVTEDGSYLPTDNTGYSTPSSYPGYSLAWSNEFSESGLDFGVWGAEIGNGSNGWGNKELEYYTNSTKNLFLSNGNLIIEARKESINGFNYSSARINTGNKKTFTYGRIDIRAKLPVSTGMWPALWMLGTNIGSVGWPACGEIDIMELVGSYPNRITGTMHWALSGSGADVYKNANYTLPTQDFSAQFHVFSIVWQQDAIKWYVDDQLYLSTTKADVGTANYPFNADQFFIFNVAVGGNWPGPPDNTTIFPQRMFVDYVRVFQ